MREAGPAPEQILLSATPVAADCMHLPDLAGVDFLLLQEKPLADIAAMRSLRRVYIAGREAAL